MPHTMTYYPQTVVIEGRLYVGGGCVNHDSKIQGDFLVMVYDINEDTWTMLPPYDHVYFSLAALNKCLVLVGGKDKRTGRRTNILAVWDEKAQRWCHPYPPMPTARSGAAVVTQDDRWLVVAGGFSTSGRNDVELLDVSSRHWYRSTPLPTHLYHVSSAITGSTWYLLGGYGALPRKQVLCANLEALISQAISKPSVPSAPALWQIIAPTPLIRSTALVLNDTLLAVGGGAGSSAIYLYQPTSKCWVKAGELPNNRFECACAVLPCGKFVVLGGSVLPSIDIGALNY